MDNLAIRIAHFPIEALRATKAGIAEQAPSQAAYNNDLARFNQLTTLPIVAQNLNTLLTLSKNQL